GDAAQGQHLGVRPLLQLQRDLDRSAAGADGGGLDRGAGGQRWTVQADLHPAYRVVRAVAGQRARQQEDRHQGDQQLLHAGSVRRSSSASRRDGTGESSTTRGESGPPNRSKSSSTSARRSASSTRRRKRSLSPGRAAGPSRETGSSAISSSARRESRTRGT